MTLTYAPYYPGGWQDSPSTATPIIAAALQNIETGIGLVTAALPPLGAWVPADNNLLAANMDLASALSSSVITAAGAVNLVKVPIRSAYTITNTVWAVGTPASGTSTQTLTGVISPAGTLLSGSSDVGTPLKTAQLAALPLTTPVPVDPGTYAFVWNALLTNFGTTQPTLFTAGGAGTAAIANGLLTAAFLRFAVNGTGATALPSPISPASNTGTGASTWWTGHS